MKLLQSFTLSFQGVEAIILPHGSVQLCQEFSIKYNLKKSRVWESIFPVRIFFKLKNYFSHLW